tara:strand:+ start:47 stop:427 length:381 start_codon:yes stop_codon:yes gene_type:complete
MDNINIPSNNVRGINILVCNINIEVYIMTYPMPANLTTIELILGYTNTVTQGYFGMGIMLALYVIVMINLKLRGEPLPDAMLVAGWFTLIPSALLLLLGLLNGAQMFVVIVMTLIPLLWSYASKSQ